MFHDKNCLRVPVYCQALETFLACTTNESFQIFGTAIAIDIASTPFGRSDPIQNQIKLLDQNDNTAYGHHRCINGTNETECNIVLAENIAAIVRQQNANAENPKYKEWMAYRCH